MEALTKDYITAKLMRLLVHYPEAGINGRGINMLAEDFLEDMLAENVTVEQFDHAVRRHRRTGRFFPKVSDMMNHVAEYRRNPPKSKCLRIEDTSMTRDRTEEEIADAKERLAIIRAAIAKGTPEAFESANCKLEALAGR